MRGRQGLVAIGVWVAVLGYAVLITGLYTLNPALAPGGQPCGFLDSLIPGRCGSAKAPAKGSGTQATGREPPPTKGRPASQAPAYTRE